MRPTPLPLGQQVAFLDEFLVLGAVAQQVLMELADHVFRDGDLLEGIKHLIHDIGITRDLPLIASLELGDVPSAQQILDLAVGEL